MPESGYAGTRVMEVTDVVPEGFPDSIVGTHTDRREHNKIRITLLTDAPERGKTYVEYVYNGPLNQGITMAMLEQSPHLIQDKKMGPRWHMVAASGEHCVLMEDMGESYPSTTFLGGVVERYVREHTKINVMSAKEKTRYIETLLDLPDNLPDWLNSEPGGWEATGDLEEMPGSGGDIGIVFITPSGKYGTLSMVNSESCIMKDGDVPPESIPAMTLYDMAIKKLDPTEKTEVRNYLRARTQLLQSIERRIETW